MEPALPHSPRLNHLSRIGLACGLAGIAAGILVTVLRVHSMSQLFELPSFHWPMLAPLLLGTCAIGISIYAIIKEQPLKSALSLFGLGLVAIATPFLISILIVALVIALIVAIVAQG